MIFLDHLKARLGLPGPVSGELWGVASMLVALPSSIAYGIALRGVGGRLPGARRHGGILGAIAIGMLARSRRVTGIDLRPCAPAAAVMAPSLPRWSKAPLSRCAAVIFLMLVALLSGALQFA